MSRSVTRAGVVFFLCIGFWGTAISPAAAYIDPNAGSMLITAVVAFFASIGAALVVFRDKVRSWFTRKPPTVGGDPADD